MACTTILVGKNASNDGSTIIGRNDDSPTGVYTPKKFLLVQPEDQPRRYRSQISHVEIDLPNNPMPYTCIPNAIKGQGIWAAAGVNSANVSVTATETIASNERVLGADPLVELMKAKGKKGSPDYLPEKPGGIGEEDIVTLVLPYINSAREGVYRLAELLETYGTYEMNGIAFQDVNEVWWLETIGGHHWMARRVPDDCYVTMPNQLGIDYFNFEDAYSEQKNFMCSLDLQEFIKKYHLNLNAEDDFNPRYAFGTNRDSDHIYNTPRAWVLQRYFNPNSNLWDGPNADYTPNSDDIPWCRIPERKITVEDVKYGLSNHFQGTNYDPYGNSGEVKWRNAYRPIGINRTDDLAIIQVRADKPESCRTIKWLSFGSNVFNASVPLYINIDQTPSYLNNTSKQVTTENFYWVNRIIAALADSNFQKTNIHIERYQIAVQSKGYEIINKFDAKITEENLDYKNASLICQEANQDIIDMVKIETDKLLHNVLYERSNLMKNGFARSDA